jgi:adenylate cyclase
MGSSQRFNYTFLGDAGNLASRLEGLNKQFGTYFMVSGHTKALAGALDVHWREISRVRVVGKSEAVTVFEPLHPAVAAERRCELETFDSGLQAWYRGDFAAALELLAPLEASDPPSAHYCARLRHYLASPPSSWDGVWESTEK